MAGVQSAYPQIPPPYPQHAHTAQMNGSFSQAPLGSFDGSQSVHSTPAPTPPPPRPGSQQQMAYAMNGGHAQNGMMPPNSFSGYPESAMYNQQQYYSNGAKPQIYTAVYSNVSVFEMEVNGVAVMRRRADSWLNATQILKVAGVDKGKRTKVLEKEVQTGEHEKVQGGYGKYQGTWINYRRGREFCRQYGVEQLLLPLLEYDINSDGVGAQQGLDTPTKEQAMAAQRKRMYGGDGRPSTQSSGGTFFKSMSSTAANAISALNRTRVDSPSGRRPAVPRRPSQPQFSQESIYAGGGSQQSMHSLQSQQSFGDNNGILSQGASFADFPNTENQEPPRKRIRPSPSNSFMNTVFDGALDLSMQEGSPTEANQSFFSQQGQSFMGGQPLYFGIEPLPPPSGPSDDRRKEFLLDLFIDPARTDFDDHPAFLQLSGDEFEMPIDGSCNTALHWAATLARIALVRKLLEKGFDMRRANSGGETALIAACQARNNLDQNSFPALLELLGPSIEIRDGRGRTLLHHIAVSSAMKGRAAVGRYYLESLLEYVVRQGSQSSSQNANPMTLARFMSEVVNAQDKAGDTALNLAARTSTTTIIEQLLEVGADPHVGNRGGLAPVDFGVGNEAGTHHHESGVASFDAGTHGINNGSQDSFQEAQETLLTSIREVLSQSETDFTTELRERQEVLDKTNAALKESGSSLAEERRRLEELQSKAREKDDLEAKIRNLQRSANELKRDLTDSVKEGTVVGIGEADKGLDFGGALSEISGQFPGFSNDDNFNPETTNFTASQLDPGQTQLLAQLETAPVLRGRIKAYRQHNLILENHAKSLKSRSSELEERYKKIVSVCTGAEESRVDELLDSLVQAVVSEQKDSGDTTGQGAMGELARVREFLRMVKTSEDQ